MIDERLLDLANRPGKAPGGYQDTLYDTRVPFIFMNAVGTRRDVETLLHEGGHSFHYFLARTLPLTSYHMADAEFSEVASMTMELLARPYLGEFYAEGDLAFVYDDQLRLILRLLAQLAIGDAFQHWVYTTPNPDAAARHAKWIELSERFQPDVDWSGLEQYRGIGWQFLHIFVVPFYFVEYGIAQVAALRIWLNSLRDERAAVAAYKRGLALGGSRSLPELFRAAGVEFGLDDRTVGPVIAGVLSQLEQPVT
jgi:oligoendopeptidase F